MVMDGRDGVKRMAWKNSIEYVDEEEDFCSKVLRVDSLRKRGLLETILSEICGWWVTVSCWIPIREYGATHPLIDR